MLVLSRHRDEGITIDLSKVDLSKLANKIIRICVVDIRGDKARLGAEADPLIPVHRDEVYHAIQRSGQLRPAG